jgi:uncharacterized protein (TIGR02271 family)
MSRTITAMFDTRSEAEQARSRLSSSGIEADRVRIIDQESSGASGSSGGGSPGQEGFFASLKDLFMPDEDRHAYGEGIRRGGYMLVAEVDESDADRACQLLDEGGSVDFEQRQSEWRNQGWAGYQSDRQAGAFGAFSGGQESRADSTMASGNHLGTSTDRNIEEEHIPIVNEELRVGKREVERGGARVRSYVRETPVHEQVNLREEHVEIERRPVSGEYRQGAMGGDVFQEREIEMTEHAEEAVVSKEARVQEELVVRKTAEEHIEQIDDTVRHTEVDVDKGNSAFGFDKDRDRMSESERAEFERSGTSRNRDDGLL